MNLKARVGVNYARVGFLFKNGHCVLIPLQIFFFILISLNIKVPVILNTKSRRESRGLNYRVHGISCRYSDKTCKKINYISTNTNSIMQ